MATNKQTFIYNSSAPVPNVNNPFTVETSALIKAAGLTEELQVYFSVGTCFNCGPNDILWEPLLICGEPVVISPDNNHILLSIPGKYSLGDPSTYVSLTGDVNITKTENIDPWQIPKTCKQPCELSQRGISQTWSL